MEKILKQRLLLTALLLYLLNPLFADAQISREPIISYEYAYDRLLAAVFNNNPEDNEISGNRKQVTGNVYMETALGNTLPTVGPVFVERTISFCPSTFTALRVNLIH